MKLPPLPRRADGCLSDFALDRRLAGELDEEEEESVRAHLGGCARCADRAATLEREKASFAHASLPRELANRRRPRWMPRAGVAAGLLAAAAIVLLFVRRPPDSVQGSPDVGTRAKGTEPKLGFYVKHGDAVRLGQAGERVASGDALRFVYSTHNAGHLAILSVDGARRASVYYPSTVEAAPARSGEGVVVDASTVLDATLGDEVIYGVFCPEAFAIEPLRAALEASPARPPAAPSECVVATTTLRKEAAGPP